MAAKRRMTTGDVARKSGIPQQTLISWDRAGVLKATRPGRRSSKRAPRLYDEEALAAALFARDAIMMGFKGAVLRQMIGLVQGGKRKALEAAAIVTFRTGPGLMVHYFTPELESDFVQGWIKHLRDRDILIEGPTSLWTIREYLLPQAENLIRMGERSLVERLIKEIQ
jgi:DNA-binding transcriptional MerR regulator